MSDLPAKIQSFLELNPGFTRIDLTHVKGILPLENILLAKADGRLQFIANAKYNSAFGFGIQPVATVYDLLLLEEGQVDYVHPKQKVGFTQAVAAYQANAAYLMAIKEMRIVD